MTPRAFAGIVGAALVAVGIILFLLPVSATVDGASGTCDSSKAFNGLPEKLVFNNRGYEDWQDECASSTSTRQGWGWGLVGVGVVVAVGSLAVRRPEQSSVRDESSAEPN